MKIADYDVCVSFQKENVLGQNIRRENLKDGRHEILFHGKKIGYLEVEEKSIYKEGSRFSFASGGLFSGDRKLLKSVTFVFADAYWMLPFKNRFYVKDKIDEIINNSRKMLNTER